MPKVGKTKVAADLKNNLMLVGDPEGCSMYECTYLPLWNAVYKEDPKNSDQVSWQGTIKAILEEGAKRKAEGKTGVDIYPYKYITIDTIGVVQDIAVDALTKEYLAEQRTKPADKRGATANDALADPNFRIADLPHGMGHYQIRERVKEMILDMASVCHKLILTAHVKDKELTTMANVIVYVKEIALMGKLGEIVAAMVDAIGYLYWPGKSKEMHVSFISNERSTMGSRYRYLAGKDMAFSWEAIFPDEFGLPIPE